MSFLIDTDVLSELRKTKRDPSVVSWLESVPSSELWLSVVTVGEIEKGIAVQRRRDPPFAESLHEWLETILRLYEDRVIPVDTEIARRWGRLSGELGHDGADLLIAATAIENGLRVATRNTRHFEPTGAPVFNPFELATK